MEQAQPEQAAAEETAMPEPTAGQQTALRDAAADIKVRPVSAGAVPVDRAANITADDKVAAANEAASKGDVQQPLDVAQAAQQAAQAVQKAAPAVQKAAQVAQKAAQAVHKAAQNAPELPPVQPELRKTCCNPGVSSFTWV